MTGKEYLVDYIQNHNAEEIYNMIKDIEYFTYEYNDSYGAFIDFINGDEDIFNLFLSALELRKIMREGVKNITIGGKNEI